MDFQWIAGNLNRWGMKCAHVCGLGEHQENMSLNLSDLYYPTCVSRTSKAKVAFKQLAQALFKSLQKCSYLSLDFMSYQLLISLWFYWWFLIWCHGPSRKVPVSIPTHITSGPFRVQFASSGERRLKLFGSLNPSEFKSYERTDRARFFSASLSEQPLTSSQIGATEATNV